MGQYQALEILGRHGREFDARHELQLVERNRVPGTGLVETVRGSLERARNTVEKLDDVARIYLRFIDCLREERASERSLMGMHALGEQRELCRSFGIERHVQAVTRAGHKETVARNDTKRVLLNVVSQRLQAKPFSRSSASARSDLARPSRRMRRKISGAFVNWMSR